MVPFGPALSRRTALRAGVAAAGFATVTERAAFGAPLLDNLVPAPADALVDSFGVVIHLQFRDSVYAAHGQVEYWLSLLGARHVRNRLSPQPEVLDAFARLGAAGVKVQAVCGAFGDDQPMDLLMQHVRDHFPDPTSVFSAFEGINEPNNSAAPWVAETRAKVRELHTARADNGLVDIPIVAPALARISSGGTQGADTWAQAGNLGDLSPYVDYGNMHVYPQGLQPSVDIDLYAGSARRVCGNKPVMCTEGGYFTAPAYVGPSKPVPAAVAAAYTPQMILEHWNARTARFFRYELFDDPGFGDADREANWGMVQWAELGGVDLPLPKLDFLAVRRMLAAFADPGPAFTPGPVSMTLTGTPDLRSAVFAKRDGTHLVCLWLDRPIYDPETRGIVHAPADEVATAELSFGTARDITVESFVDPGRSEKYSASTSLSVGLPAGVTIVTLAPAP